MSLPLGEISEHRTSSVVSSFLSSTSSSRFCLWFFIDRVQSFTDLSAAPVTRQQSLSGMSGFGWKLRLQTSPVWP
jgi:hypothetical protein